MRRKSKEFLQENWFCIAAILFLIAYVYQDVIFGDWKLSFSNLIYQSSPWNSLGVQTKGPLLSDIIDNLIPTIESTIGSGFPYQLWNGMVGLGAPEDISMFLYPMYLLYLLPLGTATLIKSMSQFLIGFFAVYFLLREWDVDKLPAILGGILYTLCSTLVTWHGWPHSDVAMFAPFAFMLASRLVRNRRLKDMMWLSVVLYLMLVAGMPTFAAYFFYLLGAWIVIAAIQSYGIRNKKLFVVFGLFAGSVILAVMVSLPYTGQILSSVGGNGYTDARAELARINLEPEFLRLSFYPDWAQPLSRHFNECTIYIGITGMLLLFFSLIHWNKRKHIRFWSITWVILILLIFTHTFDFIFVRMPAVNSSTKFRVIALLNFASALLAAFNLQDMLSNREYYKKHWYWLLLPAGIVGGAWAFYSYGSLQPFLGPQAAAQRKVLFLIIAAILLLAAFLYSGKKFLLCLLCLLALMDQGSFARSYLPMIEKQAFDIPEPTDSIQYLQENTRNGEKIAAVGTWTLFPNMNFFYGLKDIRSHNLVNTNSDLQEYFKRMDRWFYTTSTRTAVWDIENYTLLRYLGVKYLALPEPQFRISYAGNVQTLDTAGLLNKGRTIEQSFTIEKDGLTALSFPMATYGKEITTNDVLTVTLVNEQTDTVMISQTYPLKEIKDNDTIQIDFPTIWGTKGISCRLMIESSASEENSVTVWRSADDEYEGIGYYDGEVLTGDLILETSHEIQELTTVFAGSDGLYIGEVDEFSPRFQLIEQANIEDSEEDVLEKMAVEPYAQNTIFLSEQSLNGLYSITQLEGIKREKNRTITFGTLQKDEYIAVQRDMDDRVELRVMLEEPRFLVFNEYYDKNWKATIDGQDTELLKCNYLMRGIYIEEPGEHTIIFQYKPTITYIFFYASGIGILIWFSLIGYIYWCGHHQLRKHIGKL